MAEFPDLGKRCDVNNCRKLDFLPFECSLCKKIFCLDHRSVSGHNCPVASTQNVLDSVPDSDVAVRGPSCEHIGCNQSLSAVNVSCADCSGRFCLQHRHPFDHNCTSASRNDPARETVAQLSKAAQVVEEIKKDIKSSSLGASAKAKPISAKNAATAAKIALMKLKQSAVGDPGKVPDEERFYLRLQLPTGHTWKNTADMPILFSKTWSVGKCIDVAAVAASIPNDGNKLGKKKLRFILPSGRTCEMDEYLRKLEETGDLINGGNASLVYE